MNRTPTEADAHPRAPAARPTRDTEARSWRDAILDPVNLVVIPAIGILVVARRHGVISPEPVWRIVGALLLAHAASALFAAVFPPGSPRARPTMFLVLSTALGGLFLYEIGWGAVLAITFIASATVVIDADGSRHGRTAILCTVTTILLGQFGVALGVFPSMLPEATGHGLALIEAGVAAMVIALVARGQREKEAAERRVERVQARFRALVQHASDAIVVMHEDGDVGYASPATEQVFGCPPEQLTRLGVDWVDPDHADAIVTLMRDLHERPGALDTAELAVRRADGTSRWVELRITNLIDDPAVGGYVCNIRDIGERRTAHLQLLHDAQHDPVTHVANRRCFLERLDRALAAARPGDTAAVLFVDLDHFKQINDEYGHDAGDCVLRSVAATLSELVRPNDLVARFGGDEFTVLLTELADADHAHQIAARVTAALTRPLRAGDHDIEVSASVGVALAPVDASGGEDLVRRADEAMYIAKRDGRARWAAFEPEVRAS
jgi:diguanylate cyclase (GGDEF)-like protein/PAS domain S-box-containing protein